MAAVVQLKQFKDRLPKKPYYTDDLSSGLRIADVARAIEARFIQPNPPNWRYYFIFDVDRPGAAIDWYDLRVPPPTFTIANPWNGHAHLAYGVASSIITAPYGNDAPLRYAAAIEAKLRDNLDADIGYSGLVCKNPLHGHWRVTVWETELYTLDWLADYLDLSKYSDRRKNLPPYGLGRNHTLFTRTRRWSYKSIRQGWPALERWMIAVLDRATAYNNFEQALPFNEVKATAKSVASWTHRIMGSEEKWKAYVARTHAPAIQSLRGKANAAKHDMAALGALKGKARRDALLPLVFEKHAQGMTQQGIADDLGIPRKTVSNWIRSLKA